MLRSLCPRVVRAGRPTILFVTLAALVGTGCAQGEVSTAPPPTASFSTPSDMAGFYERCIDAVSFSMTSPDGRWTASQTCDRTLLDGPSAHLERPSGYPVSFSPDSDALLFVSTGEPLQTINKFGRPVSNSQVPALYLLTLTPSLAALEVRLMNKGESQSAGVASMAVPSVADVQAYSDAIGWISPRVFRYTISIPQYPQYDGTFEVDLDQPSPEAQRVP